MPKFSIIIPVYNVEAYLVECLDSIVAQSYTDYEIICVDDGSSDHSSVILQQWHLDHPDVDMHIFHQSNKKQAAARNLAFDHAQGDYIVMLDSDDVMFPDFLQRLSSYVDSSHPDVIAYNVVHWYPNRLVNQYVDHGFYKSPFTVDFESGKEFLKYFVDLHHWGPTGMFFIFNRSLLLRHNLRFLEGVYHEDDLFITQLCYFANRILVTPDLVYCYRMREGSTMHSNPVQRASDKFTIAFALRDFFVEQNDVNPTSRCIIYNVAMNAMCKLCICHQRHLISKERFLIVWQNATTIRKLKVLWNYLKFRK